MRPEKNITKQPTATAKLEAEIDKKIIDQLRTMEGFTKISQAEMITTALKRFIATHKDYFPPSYLANKDSE